MPTDRGMIAFDDNDLYPLVEAMLERHRMRLSRPIGHHPTTHDVHVAVEEIGMPRIHVHVTLPIDLFTEEMLAAGTWLCVVEQQVLSSFRGAPRS